MNPDRIDPIIESLLAEILSGRHPPDLTQQILERLESMRAEPNGQHAGANGDLSQAKPGKQAEASEQLQPPEFNRMGVDKPRRIDHGAPPRIGVDRFADRDVVMGQQESPAAPPIVTRRSNGDHGHRQTKSTTAAGRAPRRDRQQWFSSMAVLLLAVTLGLTAWFVWARSSGTYRQQVAAPATDTQPVQPQPRTEAPGRLAALLSDPASAPTPVPSFDPSLLAGDVIPRAEPSGTQRVDQIVAPPDFAAAVRRPVENRRADWSQEVSRLTGSASQIDQLFDRYWKSLGLADPRGVDDRLWASRVYSFWTGEVLDEQRLDEHVERVGKTGRAAYLAWLFDQPDSRQAWVAHWSKRFAGKLLPEFEPSPRNVHARNLEEYLRASLAENRPWDQIVYELLSAVGAPDSRQTHFNPASGWLGQLVEQFGPNTSVVTARVGQIIHGSGLQCAQCHAQSPLDGSTQQQFWQLQAFLAQTEIRRDSGRGSWLVNAPSPSSDSPLFFEDDAGRVHAVYPAWRNQESAQFSGIANVTDRRSELALMVVRDPMFAHTAAEFLWELVTGERLLPGGVVGQDHTELMLELRELLAKHLQHNAYDIESLIGLIAATSLLALPEPAGPGESRRRLVGQPPRYQEFRIRGELPEVQRSLVAMAEFLRSNSDALSDDPVRLAQRLDGVDQPQRIIDAHYLSFSSTANAAAWGATEEVFGLIQSVLDSSLDDAQKIEHLGALVLGRWPTRGEVAAAGNVIRELPDSRRAFLLVWWTFRQANGR